MELANKVVLVTGGARRVGSSIARELAGRGARVIVHYRHSHDDAQALVADIERGGGFARAMEGDLTDLVTLQQLVREIEVEVGYVDVLVNNAADYFETPLQTLSDADWEHLLAVNLGSPFRLARRVSPMMLNRGAGKIINITDIHGERYLNGYLAYCVSKAGLDMLTRGLAVELAPTVQVNGVAPGAVLWPAGESESERKARRREIPMGREGTPEDVAGAVRFLIEDGDYITGQILSVDGGRSIV